MQSWSDFDRIEYEHYWYMWEDYNEETPYEEDEEEEKKYFVTYSYKGCRYEYDYTCQAWDEEEAEFYFWKAVKCGRITKGIPKNLEDIEILEIWEAA